jgi:quercetin dioxygenase-like cupin family protein
MMLLSGVLLALLASAGSTPASAVPVQSEPMHRPVYADTRLRVLDVMIPPHATTLFHTHVNDIAGVTLAAGPSRNEDAGASPTDDPPDADGSVWFEPHPTPYTHRATNLGDKPIHVIGVELLGRGEPSAVPFEKKVADGRIELENARIRVVRLTLAPGRSLPFHAHSGPTVLVALGPGRVSGVCAKSVSRSVAEAGYLCVCDELRHQISNTGDQTMTLLEFEVAR